MKLARIFVAIAVCFVVAACATKPTRRADGDVQIMNWPNTQDNTYFSVGKTFYVQQTENLRVVQKSERHCFAKSNSLYAGNTYQELRDMIETGAVRPSAAICSKRQPARLRPNRRKCWSWAPAR